MATLVNDRNELLYNASSRVTGASVTITPGAATSVVFPKIGNPVPSAVTLTANTAGYVTPAYAWSYRFGDSGNFTTISATTNPVTVTWDAAFATASGTNNVVQYKVTVSETGGITGINQSTYTLSIPIIREGIDGINNAVVTLYKRTASSTAPILDTNPVTAGNSTYTFSTGVVAGQPTGWTQAVPASSNGEYLWVTQAQAAARTANYQFSNTLYSTPTLYSKDGVIGASTAVVYVYKRSVTAPTDNAGAVDYSFTTNAITTATLANNWSKTVPSGTDPVYISIATASSNTGTDSIAAGEWSNPVKFVENGVNTSVVSLYARNSNSGTAPTLTLDAGTSGTYTFSSGILSGTIPTGWTQAIPDSSLGTALWVTQASAISTATVASIKNDAWSTPRLIASGVRGSRQLYSSDTNYTSTYVYSGNAAGAVSYAIKAAALIATAVAGSVPTTPIRGDTVTFTNGSNYVYTITYNPDTSSWEAPGTVIDGSLLVTGSVTASKINSNGLTVRDTNGNILLGAGVPLDWSVVPTGIAGSSNLIRDGSFDSGANNNFTSLYSSILTITTASSSGTTATINFATQSSVPFRTGEMIVVSGVSDSFFNGIWQVNSATTSSAQFTVTGGIGTKSGTGGSVFGRKYIYTDGKTTLGCIYVTGDTTLLSDDYIPVDTSMSYSGKVSAKSVGASGNSAAYFGIACYDRDRNFIGHHQNAHYTNTETTLAADLVNGATTITVGSTANWQTSGTAVHTRYAGITVDGYQNYTYAKTSLPYTTYSGNVITLTSPYSGPTIKAGTAIANYYGGSGYNYFVASGITVPNTWNTYTGTINPIQPGTYPVAESTFRFGTAFVKFLILANYAQSSGYTLYLDDFNLTQSPLLADIGYTGDPAANRTYVDNNGAIQGVSSGAGTEISNSVTEARQGRWQWRVDRYDTTSAINSANTVPSYSLLNKAILAKTIFTANTTTSFTFSADNYFGMASCTIYSPNAWTWSTSVSHDDAGQIYVNGQSVYSSQIGTNNVSLSFPAGWSTIELLWAEQGGSDNFTLTQAISARSEVTDMYAGTSLVGLVSSASTTATWNTVSGTGKPSDNANNTYVDANGAIQGVSQNGGTLVSNSLMSLTSNGVLNGGSGGSITNLDPSQLFITGNNSVFPAVWINTSASWFGGGVNAYNNIVTGQTITLNGTTNTSHTVITSTVPDGSQKLVYRATSSTIYGAQGGWDSSINVTSSKPFRYTVFVRVTANASGNIYHGCSGVTNVDGSANTNAYFLNIGQNTLTLNRWYLLVGYIYPSNWSGGQLSSSGLYDTTTGAKVVSGTDFKWVYGTTTCDFRSYQYYTNNSGGSITDFFAPAVYVMDGMEPSLQQLLAGGLIAAAQSSADNKLAKQSSDILSIATSGTTYLAGIRVGNLVWDTNGARTSGSGLAITPTGIIAYNTAGTQTFSINGTNGDAVFGGVAQSSDGLFKIDFPNKSISISV